MPITVTCECGKQFQARDEDVGRHTGCPSCGRELVVPKPASPYDAPLLIEGASAGTSGKAITSLVLGILSFFCAFFTGLPAIIFGAIGLSDIARERGRLGGRGMALAGIILGSIGTLMSIAMMAAVLLPAVQAGRAAARRAQCVNNLKQIGLACMNYDSANGQFPPPAITDAQGKPLLSWRVAILPYIEQNELYQQFKLDEPWDSPSNKALLARMPRVYACPADGPAPSDSTRYQGIAGQGGMFEGPQGSKIRDVTDGTSNTLLAVESNRPVLWTKPDDIDVNSLPTLIGSPHPGGANALFVDGSVKFLKPTTNPAILRALGTKNGNEILGGGSF